MWPSPLEKGPVRFSSHEASLSPHRCGFSRPLETRAE